MLFLQIWLLFKFSVSIESSFKTFYFPLPNFLTQTYFFLALISRRYQGEKSYFFHDFLYQIYFFFSLYSTYKKYEHFISNWNFIFSKSVKMYQIVSKIRGTFTKISTMDRGENSHSFHDFLTQIYFFFSLYC